MQVTSRSRWVAGLLVPLVTVVGVAAGAAPESVAAAPHARSAPARSAPARSAPARTVAARTVPLSSSSSSASFAGLVGEPPTYIFPMFTAAYWDTGYIPWASYLMWPPLYQWGNNGKPAYNPTNSLAAAPVFSTNAAGHTVATITLKDRKWSDGKPVTTRDVQFWMNLLDASKASFAPYVPGAFPDIVSSIRYNSSSKFTITFNKHYSSYWLLGNELDQITPIPQHAWDKTSSSGKVGNYDMTPAGAKSVYSFLQKQAQLKAQFASSPLWQVVDGPWQISSYEVSTGQISFRHSKTYPSLQSHAITQFTELPFASNTAEFDALETGQVDVGYVPFESLNAIPSLKAKGYKIANWVQAAFAGLILQYAKKDAAAPILDQLYVRQAFTHLLDMSTIVSKIWSGAATLQSGPIPNPNGKGQYVTPAERTEPYPYSVSSATSLLRDHGWKVVPGGTSTCTRPGTASNECGAGISRGAKLSFRLVGTQSSQTEYRLLQDVISSFQAAGIQTNVNLVPDANLASDAAACVGKSTCNWDMELWMGEWPLGWTPYVETGGNTFACGAASNYGNLCNSYNDSLIAANHTSADPASAIQKWENYMVHQQYQIFLPVPAYRVVAYKSNLAGVTPLDPYLQIYPQYWHFTK